MFNDNIRFIVVEGPIGVGKTTLAKRLADAVNGQIWLEGPEDNPFLERFYRSREHYALATQLHFLFQRKKQLADIRSSIGGKQIVVGDFMLPKDRLFARLTLPEDEFGLYDQVFDALNPEMPRPDLVVYLQAPVQNLIERVRRRRADWDYYIDSEYLGQVADAYAQYFLHYKETPLLIVNTQSVNPVENDSDFRQLLEYMSGIESGRHFYNPVSES